MSVQFFLVLIERTAMGRTNQGSGSLSKSGSGSRSISKLFAIYDPDPYTGSGSNLSSVSNYQIQSCKNLLIKKIGFLAMFSLSAFLMYFFFNNLDQIMYRF
jgi:hypothetical protein